MIYTIISLVLSLAWAENGVSDSEILIGQSGSYSIPLIGPGSKAFRDGAVKYYEKVNNAGGVHGRKIELIALDDAYEPAKTKANGETLVKRRKVFAIVGGNGGAGIATMLPLLESEKVPLLFPFAPNDFMYERSKRHIFALPAKPSLMVDKIFDVIVQKEGIKKVGVFYQDDPALKVNVDAGAKALERNKLKYIRASSHVRSETQFQKNIADLAESKVQAVYLATNAGPSKEFMKGAAAKNFFPTYMAVFNMLLANLKDFQYKDEVKIYGGDMLPLIGVAKMTIIDEFKADVGEIDENLNSRYFYGYVAARLFVEGLRRAGPQLTRQKLIDALESMSDFNLGGLKINLGPNDHTALEQGFIYLLEKGKMTPVD